MLQHVSVRHCYQIKKSSVSKVFGVHLECWGWGGQFDRSVTVSLETQRFTAPPVTELGRGHDRDLCCAFVATPNSVTVMPVKLCVKLPLILLALITLTGVFDAHCVFIK